MTGAVGGPLQTSKRNGRAPSLLCPPNLWPDAPITADSRLFQSLYHSIAGSDPLAPLAGDTCAAVVQCSSPDVPWVCDPHLGVDADSQDVPASLAQLPDHSHTVSSASTHHISLMPPQTRPQYSQFWAEGPSGQSPAAGLDKGPLQKVPAAAGSLREGSRSDDSVAITPGDRSSWDWSYGPLDSFRALHQQQQQQLIAAQRCLHKPLHVGSRPYVFKPQRNWQNPLPAPLPESSSMRPLFSQQPTPSQACIGHRSSSASQPRALPQAHSNEALFSSHDVLLPLCSSSSARQPQASPLGPHPPQRSIQPSSSLNVTALLSSPLPGPGLPQLPQLPAHTSSSALQLLPPHQPPLCYPPASPSGSVSLSAFQDATRLSSSAFQHAASFSQLQNPHSPSVFRAPTSPLPWQINASSNYHGLPQLGSSGWSLDAVVPDITCRWTPEPSLMAQDGKTLKTAYMDDPCGTQLDLQEVQRCSVDWMAADPASVGTYDALFHF